MAQNTTFLCDCCGRDLPDATVTHSFQLLYVDASGGVVTALYGIDCGCGPALVLRAREQRESEHKRMVHAVPKLADPVNMWVEDSADGSVVVESPQDHDADAAAADAAAADAAAADAAAAAGQAGSEPAATR